MKEKYIFFVLLLLLLAFTVYGCAGTHSEAPDCKSVDVFCVGLVTERGVIDDHASNQAAWEGIQQAGKEQDMVANYIETTDARDYEKNISTFGEAGYDVIVTAGYAQSKATLKSAGIYPNSMFIGIDQAMVNDMDMPSNLVILEFPEDQAGFLAGVLAVQMSTTKKIGAVCVSDGIPYIWRYCEGYKAGALFINSEASVLISYHHDVGFDQAFNDPVWGKYAAEALILEGADVIFGVGGETATGAIQAAADQGVYVIGFDNDMYDILPESRNMLLSSATKLVAVGVSELVLAAGGGTFPGGERISGKAGYAPFHNMEENISDEIKKQLEDVSAGLEDGSIKTGVDYQKPAQ